MTARASAVHGRAFRRLPSGAGWLVAFVVVLVALAGVMVPRSDWVTPPHAGDKVAVYTSVEPTAGPAFTSLATPLAP